MRGAGCVALLVHWLLLWETEAGVCTAEGEGACHGKVSSSSLLQQKSERVHKSIEVVEKFGDEKGKGARKLRTGERHYEHAGSTIRITANSFVANNGSGRWIFEKQTCTQADIDCMVKKGVPPGMSVVKQGHPDDGGLCLFILHGTEIQVKDEVATHYNCSGWTIDADVPIDNVPEINPGNSTTGQLLELRADRNLPWGLDRIDDDSGMDGSYTSETAGNGGQGVNVYVFDTGIRTTHQDFEGRAFPALESLGKEKECSSQDTDCAYDQHGHGTHCAGTIGGRKYGVAKKVHLHAVKVIGEDGGAWSWIVEAMEWVNLKGKKPAIVSASLGGPKGDSATSAGMLITSTVNNGVIVVVAAGNEGDDACNYSPAFIPAAITVGATAPQDHVPDWSNIGECVDIFAPGDYIMSADIESNTAEVEMSGTSMAAPHVAGAVALLMAQNIRSAEEIRQQLLRRATSNKITGLPGDTENKLLYVAKFPKSPTPAPPPTPPPLPVSPITDACGWDGTFSYWCKGFRQSKEEDYDWIRTNWMDGPYYLPDREDRYAFYVILPVNVSDKNMKADWVSPRYTTDKPMKLTFKFSINGWDTGSMSVLVGNQLIWTVSSIDMATRDDMPPLNTWNTVELDIANFDNEVLTLRAQINHEISEHVPEDEDDGDSRHWALDDINLDYA